MSLQVRVELVAMAPAGDVLFVRRADDLWLVRPPAAGDPRPAAPWEVEDALTLRDFDLVQQEFGSWADLEAEVERRAADVVPEVVVDVAEFDEQDVRDTLDVVEEWLAADRVREAFGALVALVGAPVVRESDLLTAEVQALLGRSGALRRDAGRLRTASVSDKVMERMNSPLARAA